MQDSAPTQTEINELKAQIASEQSLLRRYRHNLTTNVIERRIEHIDEQLAALNAQRERAVAEQEKSREMFAHYHDNLPKLRQSLKQLEKHAQCRKLLTITNQIKALEESINEATGMTHTELLELEESLALEAEAEL